MRIAESVDMALHQQAICVSLANSNGVSDIPWLASAWFGGQSSTMREARVII